MLCWLSLRVAVATDGGLKCFVNVNVNVSGLEGLACWSSMNRKEVGSPLDCCCVGWMTWLDGICVSGMVKINWLAAQAGCCGC